MIRFGLLLFCVLASNVAMAWQHGHSNLNSPITVPQGYDFNIEELIRSGARHYHWQLSKESDDTLQATLQKKKYLLKVEIKYNKKSINFRDITASFKHCAEMCQKKHARWKINLRRAIAKQLHTSLVETEKLRLFPALAGPPLPADTNGQSTESKLHEPLATRYLQQLKSATSSSKRKSLYKDIAKSGLDNPILFDYIEQQLLTANTSTSEKYNLREMSWASRTLAYSGLVKYRATLESITKNALVEDMRILAKTSLSYLDSHNTRNRFMHGNKHYSENLDWQHIHAANLIDSGIFKLQSVGIAIYKNQDQYNEHVISVLAQRMIRDVELARLDADGRKFLIRGCRLIADLPEKSEQGRIEYDKAALESLCNSY